MQLRRREFALGMLGTAAVGTALWSRGKSESTPLIGSQGDGTTDDTRAVQEAVARAIANGGPIDGGDRVYAVRGDIRIASAVRPWIRSLRLRQLSPDASRKTLFFENCEGVRIDQLQVDRGPLGKGGDLNSTGGLWIDGGSGHDVRNVEVFGGGQGNGIVIWNSSDSRYENFKVHHIDYDLPAAADDVVQGIWLYRNIACEVVNASVHDLTGNADSAYPTRYTRAIALGGNRRVMVINVNIRDAFQGVDVTGSDGNLQITISGGRIYQTNVGVKLANSAVDCKVIGITAERIGQYAFGAGGPAEPGLTNKTKDCDFIDCLALDVGYNNFPQRHSGFDIHTESFDSGYPRGIRFIRCRAIDRQTVKTMEYGFFNNVDMGALAMDPNTVVNCVSQGHTKAAEAGFRRPSR